MAYTEKYVKDGATWVNTTVYAVDDIVVGSDGLNYYCSTAHTAETGVKGRPIDGTNYATYWTACDGTNLTKAWAWATMLTTLAAGERANVQGAITGGTAAQSFTNAGTTANPMSIRGINSTLGDLEANGRTIGGKLVTTNFPVITYTSLGWLTLPSFMVAEHLKFTGAVANPTLSGGTANIIRRVEGANTHGTSSSAIGISGVGGSVIDDCDGYSTSTSATAVAIVSNGASLVVRCYADALASGASGIGLADRSSAHGCVIVGAVNGIAASGSRCDIDRCSFYNITTAAVTQSAASAVASITNCVAWLSGGSSKFYNSTTSVRAHFQNTNAVGNSGAADVNEGNWPVYGEIALSASPFTSTTDFTLNNTAGGGAACRGVAYPLYDDVGAWQHQDSGSGGGSALHLGSLGQTGIGSF